MRTICTPFIVSLAKLYLNYGGLVEAAEKLAVFLVSGSSNLDQSTTSRFEPLGGGYKNHYKEAATMATTPNTKPSKIYTFVIFKHKSEPVFSENTRLISTVAHTEEQARDNLKGLRLMLVKCAPVNAQEVAA